MSRMRRCGPKKVPISQLSDRKAALGVPHAVVSRVVAAVDAFSVLGTSGRW